MNALVLRLGGPMQSWGTHGRFDIRDTAREPTKSGVLGLLCAALGRSRNEPISDLLALSMVVRVDHAGTVRRDYQTAGGGTMPGVKRFGVAKASGGTPATILSSRHYLCDAEFRVALQGVDLALLRKLAAAVEQPHWPLCLGRKAFVPNPGLGRGVRENCDALTALRCEPWIRGHRRSPATRALADSGQSEVAAAGDAVSFEPGIVRLKYVIELPADDFTGEVRNDVVNGFDTREFALRRVRVEWHPLEASLVFDEEQHASVAAST
jgi:CRISPR system Cascade subunit CasD